MGNMVNTKTNIRFNIGKYRLILLLTQVNIFPGDVLEHRLKLLLVILGRRENASEKS